MIASMEVISAASSKAVQQDSKGHTEVLGKRKRMT